MELIFLGSGSAFTVGSDNFQSNLLLIGDRDRNLLLDCGSDIRFSLHAAGFSHTDITDIYISHLHSDHAGGLEYMGFSTKFDPRCNRPFLYLSKELADELWNRTLSGGMRSIGGDLADLDTFFDVQKVGQTKTFTWEEITFELVRVVHIDNGYFIMPSYGLFFEVAGTKIFLTTDTTLCLDCLSPYYEEADIIFQDCETSPFPTLVHANYPQLVALPPEIKRKMWLYGYQPGTLTDATQDGFCGFVQRGQRFDFSQAVVCPLSKVA
jgi:ribonuclease BN (tRNA processing enzyme)